LSCAAGRGGSTAAGNAAVVNGTNGIEVQGSKNTIGGATAYRNVISGNSKDGIRIGQQQGQQGLRLESVADCSFHSIPSAKEKSLQRWQR
jgi:hypothetical protein